MFDLKLVFCRIRNLQLTALNEENKLLMITYVPYIFILLITIKYQVCMNYHDKRIYFIEVRVVDLSRQVLKD